MDTKHDIPHREIGEQDDELLEQLWKQLPDSQEEFRRNRFLLPLRSYRIWGSLYLMIKLY